jgi:hypothetical protein
MAHTGCPRAPKRPVVTQQCHRITKGLLSRATEGKKSCAQRDSVTTTANPFKTLAIYLPIATLLLQWLRRTSEFSGGTSGSTSKTPPRYQMRLAIRRLIVALELPQLFNHVNSTTSDIPSIDHGQMKDPASRKDTAVHRNVTNARGVLVFAGVSDNGRSRLPFGPVAATQPTNGRSQSPQSRWVRVAAITDALSNATCLDPRHSWRWIQPEITDIRQSL